MECAVAYYRVSTRQQQRSGLGIEAQRATVARFAEAENIRIIAEYVEAETGKGANRVTVARWASIRGQKHPAVMRIQEAFARARAIRAR
jgi:resolvase-like protein